MPGSDQVGVREFERLFGLLEEHIGIGQPPMAVRDALISVLVTTGYTEPEAAEHVEGVIDDFIPKFEDHCSTSAESGQPCDVVPSKLAGKLQGYAYASVAEDPTIAAQKRMRAALVPGIRQSITSLNPADFELVCGGVLQSMGALNVTVTQYTRDGGIDFYGHLPGTKAICPDFPVTTVGQQTRFWIIGQAKHYSSGKMSVEDLRDLAGAAAIARHGELPDQERKHPGLSIRSNEPVLLLALTSGKFSPDAIQLAKSAGIIVMGASALADVLAHFRVGLDDETEEYSQEAFLGWLEGLRSLRPGAANNDA